MPQLKKTGMIPWILKIYNYISLFFIRPPLLFWEMLLIHSSYSKGDLIMDKYLNLYREMISLHGLSDCTLNSYLK